MEGRKAGNTMDAHLLVRIITAFVEQNPNVAQIDRAHLPHASQAALDKWLKDVNIPTDDPDTDGTLHQVTFSAGMPVTFVASYSGDEPDLFLVTAVIQGGTVVGESLQVAN
jgi:hypothetical protein